MNWKRCEDEDDAMRLAKLIASNIGDLDVGKATPKSELIKIAQIAESIARWARKESKR